ncbi:fructose-specific phosphotransferase system IIA component [Kineosphaera limosa]|uniref:Putative phosphotransferase system enzyme II n=1 Tax=Kineosphaera limosa NBRC 100340 TaxID=1184609 RepID=K6WVH8_9MICO|nr:PTS sugar transporter subunit IIA [Kineosphaera limosa]NYD98967.1 fructose-specific phosphotransferase system IIA component [Kineosphaera limosa]GAB97811.1 putative phosphotransferase system enzyme II [Kineosphaera limosa NBRC 100340]
MTLVTASQVILDLPTADRVGAIRALAETFVSEGRVDDLEAFLADVHRREDLMATGLPGGIAIPHCRTAHVSEPSMAFARSDAGIDWGAADGPAKLIFLIGVPEGGQSDQLAVLAQLARRLTKASFRDQLLTLTDPREICAVLEEQVIRS